MLRWLLSPQFTAVLAVLACPMCVAEFIDAHVEAVRESWIAFGFYLVMALFYDWLRSWHRYRHPRAVEAPQGEQQ